MNEQPEALRLASMIERYNAGVMSQAICEDYQKAAAELRRLYQFAEEQIGRATTAQAALQITKATHALKIATLEAALRQALEALERGETQLRYQAITAAKQALGEQT